MHLSSLHTWSRPRVRHRGVKPFNVTWLGSYRDKTQVLVAQFQELGFQKYIKLFLGKDILPYTQKNKDEEAPGRALSTQ